jgi:outer membrane protein
MWKMCIPAVAVCLLTAGAASAEIKIGVVDMRVIMHESDPGKKAKETLTSKFKPESERLEKQSKALQKQAEELKKPAASSSREALEEKRVKFIRQKQDLDQKYQEFRTKAEKEEATLLNEMREVVFRAAQDFAKKNNINYLVDAGSGILYADDSMDVTKAMVEEVNRVWKANPPASSGKGKK